MSLLSRLLSPTTAAITESGGGGSDRFIAVAALSLDESSEISMHAGHAPNFLLFDDAGNLREVIPNPYMNLHADVAEQLAELLAGHRVRLMIAGDFGAHVAEALDTKGIAHIKDLGLANIAAGVHRK